MSNSIPETTKTKKSVYDFVFRDLVEHSGVNVEHNFLLNSMINSWDQ